jgi:phospholipase/carboxylesterase
MRNDNLAGESGAVSFSERLGKKPTRGVFLTAFVTAGARAESAVRLRARPVRTASGGAQPGVTALNLRLHCDALLYVPSSAPDPAPFVLYLHGAERGNPRIFVSHGTKDQILPFETTSRRLVPDLKQAGHRVNFQEFDGPHAMPPEIARGAIEWFLK